MRTFINLLAVQSILHEECIQSRQHAINTTGAVMKHLSISGDINKVLFIAGNKALRQGLINESIKRKYLD